jgi:hypothetical protein
VSDLVERLRAIGEEEMYQAPATTKATIDEAAEELERLYARVEELEGALVAARRTFDRLTRIYPGPSEIVFLQASAEIGAIDAALTNSGAPDDEGTN